jgi:hypothetical protein
VSRVRAERRAAHAHIAMKTDRPTSTPPFSADIPTPTCVTTATSSRSTSRPTPCRRADSPEREMQVGQRRPLPLRATKGHRRSSTPAVLLFDEPGSAGIAQFPQLQRWRGPDRQRAGAWTRRRSQSWKVHPGPPYATRRRPLATAVTHAEASRLRTSAGSHPGPRHFAWRELSPTNGRVVLTQVSLEIPSAS